jgi:hypothetical protein
MLHEEPRGSDWVSDIYLYDEMHWLASPDIEKPLMFLSRPGESMRVNEVELTEFGREVLEGRQSAYPLNPIDRWVGGVHLSSAAGRLWFEDNGRIFAA